MRFLIDRNRSPRLAELLRGAGHDAVHTLDLGLEAAEDDTLLQLAIDQSRIVVSGDTDFGTLLTATNEEAPSVILFRGRHYRAAEEQAALILTHLDDLRPRPRCRRHRRHHGRAHPHPASTDSLNPRRK